MSWIVRDLWSTLETKRGEYAAVRATNMIRTYEIINRIAFEVGQRWGVFLQLNFPAGRDPPGLVGLGHRDLSILVHRDRTEFDTVSRPEVKEAFGRLKPLGFDEERFGDQGFRVKLSDGLIDCLASGVHLWCELTPSVLQVLDWLFPKAYGLNPPETVH